MNAPSFLIIQTAFIGDVILATALIEKIHLHYPDSEIDFLVRKGNEDLLASHPLLRTVLIWNKKERKIRNLFRLIRTVRHNRYHTVINVHRFISSGMIAILSRAHRTIGFNKNPLSFLFNIRVSHNIGLQHEVERNQSLITRLTDAMWMRPVLYPSADDREKIAPYIRKNYICVAPTSVWFTKQWPGEKWIEFIRMVPAWVETIYLLGAPSDVNVCEDIRKEVNHPRVINLSGKLKFLESAALMKLAKMNYVNDSAPMHLASAMNAPVTAIFCSTVPSFGFGPLSDRSIIAETGEALNCRPCGLHGFKSCPEGHFHCATSIDPQKLLLNLAQ